MIKTLGFIAFTPFACASGPHLWGANRRLSHLSVNSKTISTDRFPTSTTRLPPSRSAYCYLFYRRDGRQATACSIRGSISPCGAVGLLRTCPGERLAVRL